MGLTPQGITYLISLSYASLPTEIDAQSLKSLLWHFRTNAGFISARLKSEWLAAIQLRILNWMSRPFQCFVPWSYPWSLATLLGVVHMTRNCRSSGPIWAWASIALLPRDWNTDYVLFRYPRNMRHWPGILSPTPWSSAMLWMLFIQTTRNSSARESPRVKENFETFHKSSQTSKILFGSTSFSLYERRTITLSHFVDYVSQYVGFPAAYISLAWPVLFLERKICRPWRHPLCILRIPYGSIIKAKI